MYEELVKRLRSQCQGYGKECEDCNADGNCRSQMENEAADAIEVLSKTEKTTRWITVTERLPEPKFAREWYLVALESGCVKSLAYEKEGRTDNLFRPGWHETASPVTHWMPLPEPPKEGE